MPFTVVQAATIVMADRRRIVGEFSKVESRRSRKRCQWTILVPKNEQNSLSRTYHE